MMRYGYYGYTGFPWGNWVLSGILHLNILKQRYARGEITKKDFEEMKKDLSA